MPGSRKILVIPSWYPPDGGFFFREHSEALAGNGFSVDVLVNRITGITTIRRSNLKYLKRFTVIEGPVIRTIRSFYLKMPFLESFNVRRWIRTTARLYGKYEKKFGKPDLVIAHSSIWAGCAAEEIHSRWKIPYVIIEHRSRFTGLSEDSDKMFSPFYFPLLKKAFTFATRVVTVSDSLHAKIIETEPSTRDKILTIPNLVDTEFFDLPEKRRQKEPFTVFSAGLLRRIKGLDLLIKAFSQFLKKYPGAELRIAGRGPLRNELASLAERMGISDKVQIVGYLDRADIPGEMHRANVFVLASRFEAFGVVLIEAMATGLPVIATRSGGPDRIVKDEYGILIDLENADQLAEALVTLYERYHDYDQVKIREHVMDNYSRQTVMNQYAKLINDILED